MLQGLYTNRRVHIYVHSVGINKGQVIICGTQCGILWKVVYYLPPAREDCSAMKVVRFWSCMLHVYATRPISVVIMVTILVLLCGSITLDLSDQMHAGWFNGDVVGCSVDDLGFIVYKRKCLFTGWKIQDDEPLASGLTRALTDRRLPLAMAANYSHIFQFPIWRVHGDPDHHKNLTNSPYVIAELS